MGMKPFFFSLTQEVLLLACLVASGDHPVVVVGLTLLGIFMLVSFFLGRKDAIKGFASKDQLDKRLRSSTNVPAVVFLQIEGAHHLTVKYGPTVSATLYGGFLQVLKRHIEKDLRTPLEFFRFADDEVVVVLPFGIDSETLVEHLAFSIKDLSPFEHPLTAHSAVPTVFQINAGVAFSYSGENNKELLEFAHFAVLQCTGRKRVVAFDASTYANSQELLKRLREIPALLKNRDIFTKFQPIVDTHTGAIVGYEALSRTNHPYFKAKPITSLLQAASDGSLYWKLEKLMTLTAIETFREKVRGLRSSPRLFLNLAPSSILEEIYSKELAEKKFDGLPYVIEIVERDPLFESVTGLLYQTFRGVDLRIAIDDFGTGYSNHLALINSRPDIIKVARELIEGIHLSPQKQEVYKHLVAFAKAVGTKVLAEGIETQEEFDILLKLGMDYAQGYFLARPCEELAISISPDLVSQIKAHETKVLAIKSLCED